MRLWRDGERDDCGESDEMCLVDRINEEEAEEKEDRETVIVAES